MCEAAGCGKVRRADSASGRGIRTARWIKFGRPMPLLASLLASLRRCLDPFPDKRRGMNATYQHIGMAAFAVFFMQSPSFLAHQRRLEHPP
jgi:hypothetical protein